MLTCVGADGISDGIVPVIEEVVSAEEDETRCDGSAVSVERQHCKPARKHARRHTQVHTPHGTSSALFTDKKSRPRKTPVISLCLSRRRTSLEPAACPTSEKCCTCGRCAGGRVRRRMAVVISSGWLVGRPVAVGGWARPHHAVAKLLRQHHLVLRDELHGVRVGRGLHLDEETAVRLPPGEVRRRGRCAGAAGHRHRASGPCDGGGSGDGGARADGRRPCKGGGGSARSGAGGGSGGSGDGDDSGAGGAHGGRASGATECRGGPKSRLPIPHHRAQRRRHTSGAREWRRCGRRCRRDRAAHATAPRRARRRCWRDGAMRPFAGALPRTCALAPSGARSRRREARRTRRMRGWAARR